VAESRTEQALASYQDLDVWSVSMDLAESCYRLTAAFPRSEMFGLTSQIRRASAAIPCNIAEGYGRGHRREYVQFLYIAQGSLKELETLVLLAVRVGVASEGSTQPILATCDRTGRMLRALIRSLQRA
jgi:four helix bundle protein